MAEFGPKQQNDSNQKNRQNAEPNQGGGPLHLLSPAPGDFVGRQKELDALLYQVRQWCVSVNGICGMDGLGKTTLALVLANRLAGDYPDGRFFLDLKGSGSEPLAVDVALGHIIHSFQPGVKIPEDPVSLVELYHSVLYGKHCLLLMDNAHDAEQVSPLIPPMGNHLIVTSRAQFILPGMFKLDLEALPHEDAVKLLLKIAPRIGKAAVQTAALCGGMPLTLRLVASLVRKRPDLGVDKILARLQDGQKRLKLNEVDSVLRLSYNLLTPELQAGLRKLSVFAGTFDSAAAAAVWRIEEEAVKVALGELLKAGLLEASAGRYGLHDLLRLFVNQLTKEEERFAAQGRHSVYYVRVLAQAGELYLQGGKMAQMGLALFDREWENITAAQAWTAQTQLVDQRVARLALDYAIAGAGCLELRLHPRERISWMESGLGASRHIADRRGESCVLNNLGLAYAGLGEMQRAISYHEKQLIIARETGDRCEEGRALNHIGNAFAGMGKMHQAVKYYEQSLQVEHETGDRRGEGEVLGRLGLIYFDLGEVDRAIAYFEQQLVITREAGDRPGEGTALGNLGLVYADLEDVKRAIGYYAQQLDIARETADRRGEGMALGNLGLAYVGLDEIRRATAYYEHQLVIMREIGDRKGEGACLDNLGSAFQKLGEDRLAIVYYEQALSIMRETGDRYGEGVVLGNLGSIYLSREASQQAIAYFEQQLVITCKLGDRYGEANVSWNLGLAYAQLEEMGKAARYMQVCVDFEYATQRSSAENHAKIVEIIQILQKGG